MVGPFVGEFQGVRYKQAVYNGEIIPGYFVLEDGRVLSDKMSRGWYLKEMARNLVGTRRMPEMMYPAVNCRVNDKPTSIRVHRLVCETYVEKPKPEGIKQKIWDKTHDSVKALVHQNMYVNHIDHDKSNFHPSNLEWVTCKENAEKYQAHKRAA